MNFDNPIERRGTHSSKWDTMEGIFGVSPDNGIPMWVADMEFAAADPIRAAVQRMVDGSLYTYFGNDTAYRNAICWWMANRHGWKIEPDWIFTTHGIVNALGLALDAYTAPGDGVVLFSPVYHAFYRMINASGRAVVECPLVEVDGRYEMDFAHYDSLMTGNERMLILCSPHNPAGRVWTKTELQALAAFARRHELLIVADEIHHDLVLPGNRHTPMALIEGVEDRLITLSAPSKTFNIAGVHTGNVTIADPDLRARYAAKLAAMGIGPNCFGLHMATAAYSPEGALWVDEVCRYLDGNRRVFDAGINAIPGLKSMPMEATYLAWVDFTRTGMSEGDVCDRINRSAQIAASHGSHFGTGGNGFMRFNIAMPRKMIVEAVSRLQQAFADLQ